MTGGRLVGVLVALPFVVSGCGGRAELGDDMGGGPSSLGGSKGSGGRAGNGGAGGTAPGLGGAMTFGGAPGPGGAFGVGGTVGPGGTFGFGGAQPAGAPGSGGAVFGGAPGQGGRIGKGGAPSLGGRQNVGGSAGAGGSVCPACRPYEPGACSYEYCDPGSGRCLTAYLDGQSCDDRNFCTVGEFCKGGVCGGGSANTCGITPSTCGSVQCNPGGWCSVASAPEGSPCKTGDLCEASASCSAGKCVPRYKDCSNTRLPGQCYTAACNSGTGLCEPVPLTGTSCKNPGDLCSTSATCYFGDCITDIGVDCSGFDTLCTYGECNPKSGTCAAQSYPDGSNCSTDACSPSDSCVSGRCLPGPRVTACINWDGCCPAGCGAKGDTDCQQSFTIEAVERGWWDATGSHQASNDNTFTGALDNKGYNSYLTFDVRGLPANVSAARLYIELEGFYGRDPWEQLSVWDVSTDAGTLEADGRGSVSIYNDLQSGASYGMIVGYPNQVGTSLVITLSSVAVADINRARGGYFSVGLHIDSLSGMTVAGGEALRFSDSSEYRYHVLEIDTF